MLFARKVPWQEPLLFKISGSQTDPLRLENFVAQHRKAAPQEPRTPHRRDWEGPLGRREHKSLELQPRWGGALRGPQHRLEGHSPLHSLGPAGATPQLQQGQEELRAGPAGASHPEPGPKSAIRTNPRLSLGWCPVWQGYFRHLRCTPSQHPLNSLFA